MDDLDRLKRVYKTRNQNHDTDWRYSLANPAYLFTLQQRQRALISLLKKTGHLNLTNKSILEIGCGSGGVLVELLALGAKPELIFGIDLLHDRLQQARNRLPTTGISCSDAQNLPFESQAFDIVLQFTAFSSVLDISIKQNMAAEMKRVLKPGGIIIWYDFWWNPINLQTHGIRLAEVKALFKDYTLTSRKVTLAPPLARIIVPISWPLGYLLESLKIFNSHYLVIIKKGE